MSETTDFSTILNRFYNRIEKDEKYAKKTDAADQSFWYLTLY